MHSHWGGSIEKNRSAGATAEIPSVRKIVFADSPVTVGPNDTSFSVDASGGDIEFNLPDVGTTALSPRREHSIERTDESTNNITINTFAFQKIGFRSELVLDTQGQSVDFYSDTFEWVVRGEIPLIILTPAQLITDTDNYNPPGFLDALPGPATGLIMVRQINLDSSTSIELTGFEALVPAVNGIKVRLVNIGSDTITLKNNISSSIPNRFRAASDFDLKPGGVCDMEYDASDLRYRITTVGPQ